MFPRVRCFQNDSAPHAEMGSQRALFTRLSFRPFGSTTAVKRKLRIGVWLKAWYLSVFPDSYSLSSLRDTIIQSTKSMVAGRL